MHRGDACCFSDFFHGNMLPGQADEKGRSLPCLTVHPDLSLVVLHHLGCNGQAQAGALARFLCGEERLKNPGLDLLGDSASGVTDLDMDMVLIKIGGQRQKAAIRFHGMKAIENQIQYQLRKLDLVGGVITLLLLLLSRFSRVRLCATP